MPGCVLRVGGKSFDPHASLSSSRLAAYRVWHIGERISKPEFRHAKTNQNSGFSCHVSRAEGDLSEEIPDGEAFLNLHRDELAALGAKGDVEFRELDFGYYCRLGQPSAGHEGSVLFVQGEYLPNSFLRLVGSLGIAVALSLYPHPEDSDQVAASV